MKKFTYEEVKKYIEEFGYKLLSTEYKDNNTKLQLQCPCGHKYQTTFNSFKGCKDKRGTRCPICYKEHRGDYIKKSYEFVKEYIESFGYQLLTLKEDYIDCKNKIKVKCPNNHIWEVGFSNFKLGTRCSYCSNNAKFTYEEVKSYIENFKYELLSKEYVNSKDKLLLRCPNGHEWEIGFTYFKNQNVRCPICNISKGERKIMDWLEKNNIEYLYEKTFDDLLGVGNGLLSYDFYLPKYNLLIEYQGEQHESQIKGFDRFEKQQEHDKRKREYAEKNGYRLLEIWYWDFDSIENILEVRLIND